MSTLMLDRGLAALLRALGRGAAAPFRILEARSTEWASATFAGARHAVALHLEGEDARARAALLRTTLAEMEFSLPGHLVADLAIVPAADGMFEIAALAFETLILEER